MPTIKRLSTSGATAEPITLGLAKAWLAVDGDAQDELLTHLLKAAREKAENYTGLIFVGGQRVAYTFVIGEAYSIPEGAEVESVSGFFDSLEALEAFNVAEYIKGISISRDLPLGYATQLEYTVTLQMPDEVEVPEVAKSAILELAAEWFKNREASVNGTISVQTQVNWERKLAELRTTIYG